MRLRSNALGCVLRVSMVVLSCACGGLIGPLGCSSAADDGAARTPANVAGSPPADAAPKPPQGGTLGAPLTARISRAQRMPIAASSSQAAATTFLIPRLTLSRYGRIGARHIKYPSHGTARVALALVSWPDQTRR
jgi:hypothetical protein